ncbi:MAG: hypothetical protein CMM84_16125 [Rhodothermaceae bacterium]|nr:hypothetical protein [Rhodothermaceae bacterium]MBC12528.1 hypothetical protein [Rhodothermaceae bacterium]
MADFTPEQFVGRLASWRLGRGPGSLSAAMERAAIDGSATIAGISRGQLMRNAKGEAKRRKASDKGPLRVVSGTLAGAVSVAAGKGFNRRGAINAVEIAVNATAVTVTLEKGVDLDVVPYARIHELGGTIENAFGKGIEVTIPARPYLRPAAERARPIIRRRAEALARGSFLQHVGGR